MSAAPRSRRKVAIVVLCLVGMLVAGGASAFYFGAFDIGPASRDLEADVAKYRASGWPFLASELAPKPAVADKDNAAPLIREARSAYKDAVDQSVVSAQEYGRLAPKLPELDASLNLAEKAAEKPGIDFHRDWDRGPSLLFPEFADMKNFAKVFAARAEWRCSHGDLTGGIADLRAGRRMGQFASSDPTMIGMLVDLACREISSRAYQRCAAVLKGDEPALQQLSGSDDPEDMPSFGFALRGEAYTGISIMRNLDKYGGAKAVLSAMSGNGDGFREPDPATLRRSGLPSDTLSRAFLDHHLRFWTQIAPTLKNGDIDAEEMTKAIDGAIKKEGDSKSLSALLDNELLPVFSQAGQAIVRTRASARATHALLKAMEIQARTGSFPTNISQIPGNWTDPFSNEPLKLTTDGKSIRIYSVGPDRKDDGGRARSENVTDTATYDIVAAYPPVKAAKS